ncbi:MAG TPA: 3-hydroxyacyl-ACP dehydratase FabZ family protein [Gemmatales bacterium]|nr:3-hydroxyacyl-ACP dehydratase FabZ family protein [Gemmatales bacterium]HMP58219.1 3-hydroxyacyl-ACP dehydratase FabZ family protein [Gemmatales bacterium]
MPPEPLFDLQQLDQSRVLVDKAGIEDVNPQRFEMQQLDAVVHIDPALHLIIGYKDIDADEFWVRGHMPDYPLMPGVIMCEAAAQLMGYYCKTHGLLDGSMIVFSGMEGVKFRGQVKVGDRFIIMTRAMKVHRRQVTCAAQGYVGDKMVFQADIIGMPYTPRADG